jgi:hypothetical protein
MGVQGGGEKAPPGFVAQRSRLEQMVRTRSAMAASFYAVWIGGGGAA